MLTCGMQEELNIPYEIKKYERTDQQLAPPELLKISPLGKAPVITDGDVALAESGAIVGKCSFEPYSARTSAYSSIEYLITKYGNGKATPPESGYLDNLYCEYLPRGVRHPAHQIRSSQPLR